MSQVKKIQWRNEEKIIEVIKPSPLKYFWHYFLAFSILFSLSFFSFWLVRQGLYGIAVFSSCIIASLALIIDAQRKRSENYWILTNERLIDIERDGFFSEIVTPIDYRNISDIHIRKRGINSRIFSLGDIVIDAESDDYAISLSSIRHPQIVFEWISQLINGNAENRRITDDKLVMKNFYKILPRLSDVEISEIKNRIENIMSNGDGIYKQHES